MQLRFHVNSSKLNKSMCALYSKVIEISTNECFLSEVFDEIGRFKWKFKQFDSFRKILQYQIEKKLVCPSGVVFMRTVECDRIYVISAAHEHTLLIPITIVLHPTNISAPVVRSKMAALCVVMRESSVFSGFKKVCWENISYASRQGTSWDMMVC
jgi:hypothetical protein